MGILDRIIRIVIVAAIVVLYFAHLLSSCLKMSYLGKSTARANSPESCPQKKHWNHAGSWMDLLRTGLEPAHPFGH